MQSVTRVAKVAILSYALPGTVLSIGFILLTRQLDQWLNLFWASFFGSNVGLVFSGSKIKPIDNTVPGKA